MKQSKLLRQMRLNRDLTQEGLAARAGLALGTVRRMESGRVEMVKLRSLVKLAKGLGEPIEIYIGPERVV